GRRRTEDGGRKTEEGGRKTEEGGRRTEEGGRGDGGGSRRTVDDVFKHRGHRGHRGGGDDEGSSVFSVLSDSVLRLPSSVLCLPSSVLCLPLLEFGEEVFVEACVLVADGALGLRSEEHTSELQSRENLVCGL